jgi:hypothetical protein
MAFIDVDRLVTNIFALGEELFAYLAPLVRREEINTDEMATREMQRAYSDFLGIQETYNQAPVGFTEVFETSQILLHACKKVIDTFSMVEVNREVIGQAFSLWEKFSLELSLSHDQYFPATKHVTVDRPQFDHELLAKIDYFKLRLNETQSQLSKQENQISQLNQLIIKLGAKLEDTNGMSERLELSIQDKLQEGTVFLESKQVEINQLVGNMAAKSIVGSYEQSAATEKKSADALRLGALIFMGCVVAMVGKTFWDISAGGFDWEKAMLKLVCTVLFSVPAAYLARESAKHRQQQYTHLQTALDLKAMGPYIASLPKERQDELKAEMAQKIFAQKNFDHVSKESYPINSQELILALFDKINDRKKTEKTSADGSDTQTA